MKTAKTFLFMLPVLVMTTTGFAQSDKQMMIKRETTSGDTRALNPQPIPPGNVKTDSTNLRVLPPNPCRDKAHCSDSALNPQPIPPGKSQALNPQPIPPGHIPKTKKKKRHFENE